LGVELQSIEDIGLLRMAGTIFCCAASIVANLAGWFCQVREVLEMTMVMMWSAEEWVLRAASSWASARAK
jgi:hypothetical protein